MLAKLDIDFGGLNFPLPYKKPDKLYVGFSAVFSGCKRAMAGNPCPDCQNPSLWQGLDWNGDRHEWIEPFVQKKYRLLQEINPEIEFFYCALGGEPLDQSLAELEAVRDAVMAGCGQRIPTVLFTGYSDVPVQMLGYVAERVNYLKTGTYLGDKYKHTGLSSGLATENQRWIKIESTYKPN